MPTAPVEPRIAWPAGAFLAALALLGLTRSAVASPPDLAPQDAPAASVPAEIDIAPEGWAIHGQATNVWQYHPGFASRIPPGPNSLDSGSRGNETVSVTLYGGVRLWPGAEAWVNPEIDQGFGLSNTLGIAGFPSGEAYKVGASDPYVKLPRLFLRQTIGLGGDTETVDPDINLLGGTQAANRVVVTIGKFSVVDVFDTNKYAHDPRNDFLNWLAVDAGAFDYAADAWGFTVGAAAEWYQDWWTIRTGLFDETAVPNSKFLATPLGKQSQAVVELEARYHLLEQPGAVRLLFAGTRAIMASYGEAVANGQALGEAPTGEGVRRLRNKTALSLNIEQQVLEDLGFFLRASQQTPGIEAYAFTDVSQSVSTGLSLAGTRWRRPDDTVGVVGIIDLASRSMRQYLAAGGVGILVGDLQLRNSGPEQIVETYYKFSVMPGVSVTADYQFIANPGYDRDRGPVSVLGGRLHAQF
jgi:high affinity Mn2+ porin